MELSKKAAIFYHGIFGYPLTLEELEKWKVGKKGLSEIEKNISSPKLKNDFRERKLRGKISEEKIKIARKAANLLEKIPTVKGIFLTGALAMKNADENSDIDLMIVTKRNSLWTTRLLVYGLLRVAGYELRKPKDNDQKDKLCLNIWLDNSALSWDKKDRNIYSAHEIAQVVPIVDKENICQRFLQKNRWILDYWPNAVRVDYELRIMNYAKNPLYVILNSLFLIFEKLAFKIQYLYMKPKITREVVTLHKAIFHPRNWGKEINELLSA